MSLLWLCKLARAFGIDEATETFVAHPIYPAEQRTVHFGGRAMGSHSGEKGPLSLDAAQALLQSIDAARAALKAEIDMAVNGEED